MKSDQKILCPICKREVTCNLLVDYLDGSDLWQCVCGVRFRTDKDGIFIAINK